MGGGGRLYESREEKRGALDDVCVSVWIAQTGEFHPILSFGNARETGVQLGAGLTARGHESFDWFRERMNKRERER